jgi:hypothetical protein
MTTGKRWFLKYGSDELPVVPFQSISSLAPSTPVKTALVEAFKLIGAKHRWNFLDVSLTDSYTCTSPPLHDKPISWFGGTKSTS